MAKQQPAAAGLLAGIRKRARVATFRRLLRVEFHEESPRCCVAVVYRLTIEVSERSLLDRPIRRGSASVPTTLAVLADAGAHLAVDGFGTGSSSLTDLVTLPVGVLKIDSSFVAGVVSDPQRRSIVSVLVGLAAGTDMVVVADGIDRPGQVTVLRALGVEIGQGMHFARPLPYHELELTIRARSHACLAVDPR